MVTGTTADFVDDTSQASQPNINPTNLGSQTLRLTFSIHDIVRWFQLSLLKSIIFASKSRYYSVYIFLAAIEPRSAVI